MPELPDLEVFAENLTKLFKGKVLERIGVKVTMKLKKAAVRPIIPMSSSFLIKDAVYKE